MARNKKVDEAIRKKYISMVSDFLKSKDEDVLVTKSNELTMPWKDEDGNEGYITLVFKVPTGERNGKEYNGYDEEKAYAFDVAKKEQDAKAKAEAKAKKIAKDKAAREAKKAE